MKRQNTGGKSELETPRANNVVLAFTELAEVGAIYRVGLPDGQKDGTCVGHLGNTIMKCVLCHVPYFTGTFVPGGSNLARQPYHLASQNKDLCEAYTGSKPYQPLARGHLPVFIPPSV